MVIRIVLLMCFSSSVWSMNTLQISKTALSTDCIDYCVTGVCFWLKCSLISCKIKESVRVKHRNPEVVISVYPEPGDNPWQEMRKLYRKLVTKVQKKVMDIDPAASDIQPGGGKQVNNRGTDSTALRFYEAQAIGHPLADKLALNMSLDLVCPSASDPFKLYFSSELDSLSWRSPIAEIAYLVNFIPGVREIGEDAPWQTWGGVFPRNGSVIQHDSAKGAAVIAQRVANIISQESQPHIYMDITDNFHSKTWLPGEVKENDFSNHAFQMLYPKQENTCEVFGKNDALSLGSWSDGKRDDQDRYAFTLWRPYECCSQRGKLIKTVDIQGVCI